MAQKQRSEHPASKTSADTRERRTPRSTRARQREETEKAPLHIEEKSRGKKTDGAREGGRTRGKKEPVKVFEEDPRSQKLIHQLMPWLLMLLSVFILVCFLLIDVFTGADADKSVGRLGQGIRDALCGLFGFGAFFTPVALALLAVGWRRAVEKRALLAKVLYAVMSVLMLSAFLHVVLRLNDPLWGEGGMGGDFFSRLWRVGVAFDGGGVVGGLLGELLYRGIGLIGSAMVAVTLTAIFVIFLCGVTPGYVMTLIRYRYKLWRERKAEENRERKAQRAEEEKARLAEAEKAERAKKQEAEAEKAEREKREKGKKKAEQTEELPSPVPKPAEEPKTLTIREAEATPDELPAARKIEPTPAEPHEEYQKDTDTVFIIPSQEDAHTSDDRALADSESEGVYLSAAEIAEGGAAARKTPVREGEKISLNEIFSANTPLTAEQKAELAKAPKKEGENGERSEVDMTLLAGIKQTPEEELVAGVEDDIEEIAVEPEEKVREYVFPPIDLLAPDTNAHVEDSNEELMANAKKLVETLKSFKVGVKDISYSRGPTITRYEIQPEVGIRVRSIANLVDDIALNLATTGVRIEAPIPNKPAVGIEVPKQNPSTVFLRSLIDTEKFAGESSKLTACLGADVAGKPMYFNIAKMPHLLIAGATGMGKSVCINSIIVSLLYKARPDEVKLILIDPKKVEFNIYKDIPHLYAPIVSDPAKAAGALASAVAEMERRFELIEEVGVRDIYNYNAVTKDDPDREFMPQMVIIIDELADLMMTAADSVEASICRLAQKARAAGIHIIIGTQRPSVDVITGLIKANVPSRIAFTVASQVDSRTIIDIAGAEKLIGRGDMLFAPVGAAKPMRVQGAFVHESEVEKIVEFIKTNNATAHYNDEFMSRIEEEAAKCAAGGKKGGGMAEGDLDSDGLDPKFREAVKVAVETGRVATSLLQRKLEIGYGRAAKIIDQMQEMGYVSAPEGNKPRKILISKEDFMQMSINDDI